MKQRIFALMLVIALLLGSTVAVKAITFGEPDNGQHPYTGALIVEFEGQFYPICSGTLISPTIFLTAAHCTKDLSESGTTVYVSFDEDLRDMSQVTLHSGTAYTHPGFAFRGFNQPDIAVIVLTSPVAGIQPAQLPTAGLLDQLGKKNGLKGQTFTAVGYGVKRLDKTGGFASLYGEPTRWKSTPSYMSMNDTRLAMSQNPATGDSGTCFGDSGGTNLLGNTNIVVSVTSWGDSSCRSTNITYRVDSSEARAFLAQFVTLP